MPSCYYHNGTTTRAGLHTQNVFIAIANGAELFSCLYCSSRIYLAIVNCCWRQHNDLNRRGTVYLLLVLLLLMGCRIDYG